MGRGVRVGAICITGVRRTLRVVEPVQVVGGCRVIRRFFMPTGGRVGALVGVVEGGRVRIKAGRVVRGIINASGMGLDTRLPLGVVGGGSRKRVGFAKRVLMGGIHGRQGMSCVFGVGVGRSNGLRVFGAFRVDVLGALVVPGVLSILLAAAPSPVGGGLTSSAVGG